MHRKLQDSEVFDGKEIFESRTFKRESLELLKNRFEKKTFSKFSNIIDISIFDNQPEVSIKYSETEWYKGKLSINTNKITSGYGIYHYKNGDEYEGMIDNGKRNGLGEYRYNDNKATYLGQWNNDKKCGNGSYKYDCFEIDGFWKDDEPVDVFIFRIFPKEDSNKNNKIISNSNYISNIFSKNLTISDKEYINEFIKKLNEENENNEIEVELVSMVRNNQTIVFNIVDKTENIYSNQQNLESNHNRKEEEDNCHRIMKLNEDDKYKTTSSRKDKCDDNLSQNIRKISEIEFDQETDNYGDSEFNFTGKSSNKYDTFEFNDKLKNNTSEEFISKNYNGQNIIIRNCNEGKSSFDIHKKHSLNSNQLSLKSKKKIEEEELSKIKSLEGGKSENNSVFNCKQSLENSTNHKVSLISNISITD